MTNNLTINQIEAIRTLKKELMAENSSCSSFFEKAIEESSTTVDTFTRDAEASFSRNRIGVGSTICIVAGGVGLALGLLTKNKEWVSYISAGLMTIGAGGIIYSRKDRNDTMRTPKDKNSGHTLDFDKINNTLYNFISKVVKSINQRWNDCIDENRKNLTKEILSSNYTESEKSSLLAKAAISAMPSITIAEYSIRLERLCNTKNEEGLRNFMDEFRKDADREVQRLYKEQLRIYEEIG